MGTMQSPTALLVQREDLYDAETSAFHATCRFILGIILDHGSPSAAERAVLHQCLIVCRPYTAEQCASNLKEALVSGSIYSLFIATAFSHRTDPSHNGQICHQS